MFLNLKKSLFILIISFLILSPSLLFAQSPEDPSNQPNYTYKQIRKWGDNLTDCLEENYNTITGTENDDFEKVTSASLSTKIGIIISYVLAFLGVIFLVLIVISGFQWLTAGGNEETVTTSRKRIINAVVGLIIILSAYVITAFVTDRIERSIDKTNTVSINLPSDYLSI